MFGRFIRIFIKNSDDVENPRVRENYGKLTGITGIVLNLILCAAKIITGAVTGAISVLSDGVNNLSDAASSVITLAGFKISAKKPDKEHPFGHGRMEYFAGLLVSLIILLVAFELFSESVSNIIAGKTPSFGSDVVRTVTLCVLAVSIAVKLWMALFNRYCGKKINSVAMRATAADSASDCVSVALRQGCRSLTQLIRKPRTASTEKRDHAHEEAEAVFGADIRRYETQIDSLSCGADGAVSACGKAASSCPAICCCSPRASPAAKPRRSARMRPSGRRAFRS